MLQRSYQTNLALTPERPKRVMIHPKTLACMMLLWWTTKDAKKLICSLRNLPWCEAVKNGKWKTNIKSEASFRIQFTCLFSLFVKQSKNVTVLEKVSKPAYIFFFLLIFFIVLPISFILSLCLETEKRKDKPPAGLKEAALRAPSGKISPHPLSGTVHLAVAWD